MSLESLPTLFVEGRTDEYVITHLLMKHGIAAHAKHDSRKLGKDREQLIEVVVEFLVDDRTAEPEPTGGREKLLDGWSIQLRSPKQPAIGLVLDADTDEHHQRGPLRTWAAVRDRLSDEAIGIHAPDVLDENGFIGRHALTNTPVGVWIMPDNQREGSIEDFLRQLIAGDDTLIELAEGSARLAKLEPYFAKFAEKDLSKAVVATWLAWQKSSDSDAWRRNQTSLLST